MKQLFIILFVLCCFVSCSKEPMVSWKESGMRKFNGLDIERLPLDGRGGFETSFSEMKYSWDNQTLVIVDNKDGTFSVRSAKFDDLRVSINDTLLFDDDGCLTVTAKKVAEQGGASDR